VIGTTTALIGAAVLLVLILAWVRGQSASRHLPAVMDEWLTGQDDLAEACPPEFVSQIFSSRDFEFISRLE